MDFNSICEKVYKYFKDKLGIEGLCAAVETEEYIVFSGGNPNVVNYGGQMVSVDKKDLSIDIFEPTNVSILMSAKKVEIPNEYKTKS